jgi:phospholipase D1/2
VENQYLTSAVVCDALCARLRRRKGPEVVIVLPRETGDWLEQHTMDVLRAGDCNPCGRPTAMAAARLLSCRSRSGIGVSHGPREVDDRRRSVAAHWLGQPEQPIDGIWTPNATCASRRGTWAARAAIAGLRRRLLGAFLDVDTETVAAAEEREPGLIAAIESLRSNGRTLAPLSATADPEWERQLPDDRLIDPDRPLNASDLSDAVIGYPSLGPARRRLWLGAGLVALLIILAGAWRWTELGDWLEPYAWPRPSMPC